MIYKKIIAIIIFLFLFFFFSNKLYSRNFELSNIKCLQKSHVNSAYISAHMNKNGIISLKILNSDNERICKLLVNQMCFKGTTTFFWNGKDDQGRIVPDDAYYFVIKAEDSNGITDVYNPTHISGGKKLYVEAYEKSDKISFSLSKDARVRLRIGIHNGPLLKTLLDWKPLKAGTYSEEWDGKDDTGKIDVRELPYSLYIEAYTLPENTIITTGNDQDLLTYRLNLKNKKSEKSYSIESLADEIKNIISNEKKVIKDTKQSGYHPNYSMSKIIDQAPKFSVTLDNPSPLKKNIENEGLIQTVKNTFSMSLHFEQLTDIILRNQPYEIISFIDNQFYYEEEQGSYPYTLNIDSRLLTNGKHVVTFNVSTMKGQVGSASVMINVQNE